MKRVLVTATAVALAVVLNPLPAHAADGWVGGSLTVSTSTVKVTKQSNNQHSGYNFFLEHYNYTVPGGIRSRWVRCDLNNSAPVGSSTSGSWRYADYSSAYTQLGSSFLVPTCAKAYVQARTSSGEGKAFGYGQYFNPTVVP